MFDHITLKVRNFATSLAFYEAALAPLGFVAQYVDKQARSAGFGPEGRVGLWLAEGDAGAAVHIAFATGSRAEVGAFAKAATATGGTDNGAPGLRPDYGATYFAAFVLDPDGNNLEAVTFAS